MKNIITVAFILGTILNSYGQCAMCKKAAEDAGGINGGILYIMAFPYLILAFFGVIIYYRVKKLRSQKH